jgi:hypothetical protein
MNDGKAMLLAVWACLAVLMILIYEGAGNTTSTETAPPPIPNAGPSARLTLFNDTSHYAEDGAAVPAVPQGRLSKWWNAPGRG